MERFDWQKDFPDILVIDIGEKALQDVVDVGQLFDEIESIAEDYPGHLIIFKV